MRRKRSRIAVLLACLSAAVAITVGPGATLAGDGFIGVFFDANGRECSGTVPTASFATLHVLLLPEGATFSGITGAEFRILTPGGGGFLFRDAVSPGAVMLGDALGGGTNVAFPSCKSGSSIPLMTFQVFATGAPASDAVVQVVARTQPSNNNFMCAAATLCDDPTYTEICVSGSAAVLNPSGARPCGTGRIDSQWSRMKDLYRR